MARTKRTENTDNIVPRILREFDGFIEAVNNDWGTIAFKIPKGIIEEINIFGMR